MQIRYQSAGFDLYKYAKKIIFVLCCSSLPFSTDEDVIRKHFKVTVKILMSILMIIEVISN